MMRKFQSIKLNMTRSSIPLRLKTKHQKFMLNNLNRSRGSRKLNRSQSNPRIHRKSMSKSTFRQRKIQCSSDANGVMN